MTAMRGRRRWIWATLTVALGVAAFTSGVLAASFTVQSGSELGKGAAESGTAITWWSQTGVTLQGIPSPVPAVANASAATPTLLTGAKTSYAVGTAHANDTGVRWDFQLKAPPVLTEFEITVSLLNLTGSAATVLTVYLETPTTAPSGTVLVSLFVDNGVGTTGFRVVSQLSQQCTSFGTCP